MISRDSRAFFLVEAARLFWEAADAYAKRQLFYALIVVAGGALLVACAPLAFKLLVDDLSGGGSILGQTAVGLVIMYALSQFLWRCSSDLRLMLHGLAEQRVKRHVSRKLFEHLMQMPLRFHLERKVGAIGETVEQGLRGYDLLLQHVIFTVVPVTVEFVVVSAVLLHFHHSKYLVVLALASVAYAAAFRRWANRIYEPSEQISKTYIDSHAVMIDSLSNFETVKYFDAERMLCQRYEAALTRTESAWRRFFAEYVTNGFMVATIFAVSLAMSLLLGVGDIRSGNMTIGDFVLINSYVIRLVQPLELIGLAARDIAQGLAFLNSMLLLLTEKTETNKASPRCVLGSARGQLAFENVSFSYQEERVVLRDVSFTVESGKTVAIVGVSGSGKSSLIRLLFRLYEPDNGRILLDGVPTTNLPLSTLRQAIGIIPQDTVLLHDTIANNIGLGKYGASDEEIEEAARVAHLHDFIVSLPDGYETVVGERGMKLSGGERQRIAIARAALKRPSIFVCDEATSSLDTRSERDIMRNLIELSSTCTTLIIAHRLSTIVHADEIVVLHHGVIVERGAHTELRDRGGYYAGLWDAQSGAPGRDEIGASVS
jgi:ABC-type transport system involved in Fe-S cluster assembly fused permease/ATPase subunit